MPRQSCLGARRIVVKVGTSTLTYPSGKLNLRYIKQLARQAADVKNENKDLVLVTSGAVSAGLGRLGLGRGVSVATTIPEKQAAAAVGQGVLMHVYEKVFAEFGQTVAQVLLTREDVSDRKRYLNSRNTLLTLMDKFKVVPVVNENDTVAVEEIKFGENDTLSALVACLVDADLLIILSDIPGLYTDDPRKNKDAKMIPLVEEITPEIEGLAQGAGSAGASGGMQTKIQAARIAMSAGITMVIAHGGENEVIRRIVRGDKIGTLFVSKEHPIDSRKRWIAFGSAVQGRVVVDEGARRALVEEGRSLLPKGIIAVEGKFDVGHTVSVASPHDREIARGIVNYSRDDLEKIKGLHSKDIHATLGYKYYDEAIHRDNLVLIG